MSLWINHFVDFEKRPRGENRLILGFQYCPSPGVDEKPRKVKIRVKQNLTIPTRMINSSYAEKVKRDFLGDSDLSNFFLTSGWQSGNGDFLVLEATIPHDRELIKRLSGDFQKGGHEGGHATFFVSQFFTTLSKSIL